MPVKPEKFPWNWSLRISRNTHSCPWKFSKKFQRFFFCSCPRKIPKIVRESRKIPAKLSKIWCFMSMIKLHGEKTSGCHRAHRSTPHPVPHNKTVLGQQFLQKSSTLKKNKVDLSTFCCTNLYRAVVLCYKPFFKVCMWITRCSTSAGATKCFYFKFFVSTLFLLLSCWVWRNE